MRVFTSVVVSALVIGCAFAAGIGEKCSLHSECQAKDAKSYCSIISPTCNSGTCACIPGFAKDSQDGTCKRSVQIGATCSASDTCPAESAYCQSGTCQCGTGYKTGLKGGDCVSTLKTERYAGQCYDTVQCYYNMVCSNNKCTCYTGFKVIGDYECAERDVGDSCSSDDDCSRTPNTACSSSKCQCATGYKQVTYQKMPNVAGLTCIPTGESQLDEGKACNHTSIPPSGTAICGQAFACTSCDASTVGTKCSRVQAALAGASSVGPVLATTLFFLVSSFVLHQC